MIAHLAVAVAAVDHRCLRRKDLRSDEDDRLVDRQRGLLLVAGQLGQHPPDDVAQVGQALLEVRVGDLAEQGGMDGFYAARLRKVL